MRWIHLLHPGINPHVRRAVVGPLVPPPRSDDLVGGNFRVGCGDLRCVVYSNATGTVLHDDLDRERERECKPRFVEVDAAVLHAPILAPPAPQSNRDSLVGQLHFRPTPPAMPAWSAAVAYLSREKSRSPIMGSYVKRFPVLNSTPLSRSVKKDLRCGSWRSIMRTRFEIYCDILYCGLKNIVYFSDDSKRCLAEADHLHNIPELLRNPQDERLHRFYWDAMRPSFISVSQPEWLVRFERLWAELEEANRRESVAW